MSNLCCPSMIGNRWNRRTRVGVTCGTVLSSFWNLVVSVSDVVNFWIVCWNCLVWWVFDKIWSISQMWWIKLKFNKEIDENYLNCQWFWKHCCFGCCFCSTGWNNGVALMVREPGNCWSCFRKLVGSVSEVVNLSNVVSFCKVS